MKERLLLLFLAAAITLHCGDDGGGAPTPDNDLGLPQDLQVSALTDEQAVALCRAAFEFYDGAGGESFFGQTFCLSGSLGEPDAASCEVTRLACEAQTMPQVYRTIARECQRDVAATRASCSATVAEIDACIEATLGVLQAVNEKSCADAPEDAAALTASPEACTTLPRGCAALILQADR